MKFTGETITFGSDRSPVLVCQIDIAGELNRLTLEVILNDDLLAFSSVGGYLVCSCTVNDCSKTCELLRCINYEFSSIGIVNIPINVSCSYPRCTCIVIRTEAIFFICKLGCEEVDKEVCIK